MTSYKGLLNKIEAFCNAHLQIKKYGGEFKEQMPNFSTENEKYPIVYVVPTSDLSDLNTNQFTLDVYCVDIIQKDRANINTIVSDCNLIVNDLYLYFLDGNDLSIDVIGASSGTPINNFDLDYSAGWVKSITFEVQAYSVCAIPMNPINPNPPQVCNPANYNLVDTLDNILSSGSIDSGATENIVVGNSTVENSDASYSASVLAEGSLVLPDITVDVQNSALTVVNTATVASVQDVTISAPDGTINIKKTGDGTISSQSVPSGATIDYSVADNAITVNSGNGFSIDATDPLDIVLTDGTSSVTPTSVTYSQGQHKVDIVLPASGTPIDADAQAFLTATGITNATITSAINTLVTELKSNYIWNKIVAIYPFVGGTALTHKWNLKDPRDLNAAFRLSMFGGLVHDSNGVKGNAINAYMDTNLNPRDFLAGARMSMGNYIRLSISGGGSQCDGVRDSAIASWLEIDYTNQNTRNPEQGGVINFATTPLRLCQTVRSSATRLDMYINGTSVGNNTTSTTLLNPNHNVFIFARNTIGTAGNFNSVQSSFFYIASSLTQAEAVTLNTLVNNFQTTLGRNV